MPNQVTFGLIDTMFAHCRDLQPRVGLAQLLAEAAGEIRDIEPLLARKAHNWILQLTRSQASSTYFDRQLFKTLPQQERQDLLTQDEAVD